MTRPLVGITMGDAAGVGPEIIVKALISASVYSQCRPLVIGDAGRLERAASIVGSALRIRRVGQAAEAGREPSTVDCLDLGLIPTDLPFGQVSGVAGNAAFRYLETAIRLARAGEIDAICTAPLNKEALHLAGHRYPGHTEILADLTGSDDYAMMLAAPRLKVIHVTTHLGLLDAIGSITPERVYRVITMADETLRRAGLVAPRIGVCGINPHAGENGLFGRGEEEEKVAPAVRRARKEGIVVSGPLAADTLFYLAVRGDYDMVVAMYHDQGHIPVKVMGLEAGVNITVGLPIVRTSVDHGTAFDIAGTGTADERSLAEAIRQAAELAPRRQS